MPRLILLALAGTILLRAADPPPASLLITYQCAPQDRPALRRAMLESGLARFQHWQEAGLLSSYLILFSRHVDTGNWDMLAVLNFADYTKMERWNEIEHRWPAGLAKEELSLMTDVRTDLVDMVHGGDGGDPPEKPVFVVPPLEIADASEAVAQIEGPIASEANRRVSDKAIAMYQTFLTRPPGSTALLIQEYASEQAFEERARTNIAVRPSEAGITEKRSVVAEELRLR